MTRTGTRLTAGGVPAAPVAAGNSAGPSGVVALASPALRYAWIILALLVPIVWGYFAVYRPASDATSVYASSSLDASQHWSTTNGVIVRAVYGGSTLADVWRVADDAGHTLRVTAVDGVPIGVWADRASTPPRVGDRHHYTIAIEGTGGTQAVDVVLGRYPLGSAVAANPGALALWVGLGLAGSIVFWRRPGDPAAWSLLALATVVPIGMTAFPFGLQVVDFADGQGFGPYVVGELANCVAWGSMLFFALVFPTSMALLRRRPWVGALPFALPFLLYLLWAPVAASARPSGLPRTEVLVLLSAPSALAVLPLIVVVLVARTRSDLPLEHRLALRVVLSSVLLSLVAYVVLIQVPLLLGANPRLTLSFAPLALLLPLAGIVLAVLRYRLYEIDLIIRRSLLAALVVALLAIVFVGVAVLVYPHLPFGERGSVLAGGAGALALFPLGRWLSIRLNRLVFGARDDPHRVVSELRGLGASTSVEASLSSALSMLADTLRLGYAAVEVDAAEGIASISVAVGEPHRRPTVIELENNGRPWGRLTLGVAAGREQFGPRDSRLLDTVGAQVGALVQGLVMNQALRLSRQRVITAREEERRRIQHDLHDGLGPALAIQAMRLESARDLLSEDEPDRLDETLLQLLADNAGQISDIRRLVDDLRPRALDQFGLVTALRQQAAGVSLGSPDDAVESATVRLGTGGRTALRCSVEAGDVEPLPAAVEVAAYRIALEAVNNVAKHSNAATCRVILTRDDDQLTVVIADDGTGLSESRLPGVGLTSMRERAEELGGTFDLTYSGNGTTVTARLPLVVG